MTARARPAGETSTRLILSAAVLLVTLMPTGRNLFWGIGVMADWPAGLRLSILIAALLVIWTAGRGPRAAADDGVDGRGSIVDDRIAAALGLSVAAVWILFPCRTLLFGDSGDIVNRTALGHVTTPRSPLYNILALGLTRLHLVSGAGESERALRLISLLSGFLYLGVLFLLWRRRRERIHRVTWALLIGGYLGLFQNYIEAYAPFLVVLAAFMVTLLEPVTRGRDVTLAILSVAAVGFHSLGGLLVPIALFVLWRRNSPPLRLWTAAGSVLLVAFFMIFQRRLPATLRFLDVSQVMSQFGSEWGLLAARPWSGGLFSPGHLSDTLNAALLGFGITLFAGLSLLAFPAGRESLLRTFRSLAGAVALLFLAARFLIATPMGPLLDWDLMALFLWPLAFCVAIAWSRPEIAAARALSPAILAAALVLAAPWWWTLSSEAASTRLLTRYRDGSPRPNSYVASRVEHALGDQFVRAGQQGDAAAAFSRACDLYPRDDYARRAGTAWHVSGNEVRAREEFKRAVQLNPDDLQSRLMLGMSYFGAGIADLARREFQAVIDAHPEDGRARFGLGILAAGRGDNTEMREHLEIAVVSLRQSLDAGRENFSDRVMLSRSLTDLGRFEEALPELEILYRQDPNDPQIVYSRGTCLMKLGRLTEARDVFQRGVRNGPRDVGLLLSLGDVDMMLEDWVGAADAYSRAIEIRDRPITRYRRAHVYLEMGDVERARTDVDRLLASDPENAEFRALAGKVEAMKRRR